MRVGILGPLEVAVDGAPVEIGGARLRALLIRLALDAGRPVPVEALAGALWGDGDGAPADPANAVQSLVSRLRRLLPAAVLQSGPGGYRLDVAPDAVDALGFEALVRAGQRALRAGDPDQAAQRLREALALWRGPALAEVADAPYATGPAVRLEQLRLAATEDRIEAELASGRPGDAVSELAELTAAHPLRERPRALLVKALAAAGRPAEALAAYEEFRRRLADELGVDPSPDLRETHLAVLRGEAGPVPAPPPARGNLRAAWTSFVGRDEELEGIAKQLDASRLVTLVGPGGAGKTRLATAVGAAQRARMPGGVWLVELAPVADPADVPQAALRAFDRRDPKFLEEGGLRPHRDVLTRLVDEMSGRETLLLLDNCEHVVSAAAELADELLGRCPDLRILATGREPLGILGEALYPVGPLRLPAAGAGAADALGCPSVQLFRDRAAAVRPGFRVRDDNVDAVVDICRRLDGLPLAIELAAARLRSLSEAQVAARLDDRFRLLTGGSRTALPRHRTLRAVVAWSWDLLTGPERRLADRLAVFAGSASGADVAGVCAGADLVAGSIPELLDALVDKSLVQVVGDGTRYRTLETIREYGLERLAEAGGLAGLRAAHAGHYLALAEEADPHMRGAEQLRWIDRLTVERDNLLAALHFFHDTGDAARAVRLGAALAHFWTIRGTHAEAVSWLDLALAVPGEVPPEPHAIALAVRLLSRAATGDYHIPPPDVEELRAVLRRADVPGAHPFVALIEPAMAVFADDSAAGLALVAERLSHPDPWARAMLRVLRAFVMENDGDAAGARRDDLAAAVATFREVGDRWGLSAALTALSDVCAVLGEFDAATAALEETVGLLRELNADDDAAHQRVFLAMGWARAGEVDRARRELRDLVESGSAGPTAARSVSYALLMLGELARCEGDLAEAGRLYAAAWDGLDGAPLVAPQFRAIIVASKGYLAAALGDLDTAAGHGFEAVEMAMIGKDMPVVARVAVVLVDVWARRGEPERAAELVGALEALRGGPDRSNPDLIRLTGQLREELGESAYAEAHGRGRALDRTRALARVTSPPGQSGDLGLPFTPEHE